MGKDADPDKGTPPPDPDDDGGDGGDDDDDEPVTRGEVRDLIADAVSEAVAPLRALVEPAADGGDKGGGVADADADDTPTSTRDLEAVAKRAAQEAVGILKRQGAKRPAQSAPKAKAKREPEPTPSPPEKVRLGERLWGRA